MKRPVVLVLGPHREAVSGVSTHLNCLFASRLAGAFSLMAAGFAVITTRTGAIPDVVADGVHGFFVPSRDSDAIYRAVVALSADRELLARMGAACRTRIATAYCVERLANELCRLYSEMTAAKGIKALPGSAPLSGRRPPCAE
jgi:glycosyltransferase involved in cell wall biosynthesis